MLYARNPAWRLSNDAGGNHVAKIVTQKNGDIATTYYIHDACGNVIAVYEETAITPLDVKEWHFYGSSRPGTRDIKNMKNLSLEKQIDYGDSDSEMRNFLIFESIKTVGDGVEFNFSFNVGPL